MADKVGTSAQGGEGQNDREQDGTGAGSQDLEVFSTRDPHTNFFVLVAIMVSAPVFFFFYEATRRGPPLFFLLTIRGSRPFSRWDC